MNDQAMGVLLMIGRKLNAPAERERDTLAWTEMIHDQLIMSPTVLQKYGIWQKHSRGRDFFYCVWGFHPSLSMRRTEFVILTSSHCTPRAYAQYKPPTRLNSTADRVVSASAVCRLLGFTLQPAYLHVNVVCNVAQAHPRILESKLKVTLLLLSSFSDSFTVYDIMHLHARPIILYRYEFDKKIKKYAYFVIGCAWGPNLAPKKHGQTYVMRKYSTWLRILHTSVHRCHIVMQYNKSASIGVSPVCE